MAKLRNRERFVLIGVEFDRKDDGRSKQLDNLLEPLAFKCHVLGVVNAIWRTKVPPAQISEVILNSKLIGPQDRLVVCPVDASGAGEPSWIAHNAPTSSKCYNL